MRLVWAESVKGVWQMSSDDSHASLVSLLRVVRHALTLQSRLGIQFGMIEAPCETVF